LLVGCASDVVEYRDTARRARSAVSQGAGGACVSALLRHDEHMYACLTLELPRDSDANIGIVRRRVSWTTRCG
jgi:hypothetical protein